MMNSAGNKAKVYSSLYTAQCYTADYIESSCNGDQWHNRLHLAALENGIIGLLFSIMWKSLASKHIASYITCSVISPLRMQMRTASCGWMTVNEAIYMYHDGNLLINQTHIKNPTCKVMKTVTV